jgi:D-alanyl-D-alanine carboxypeptidase/D-alanyl-D-alanine-endopeptidase (penicillin-binding protein 4)
VNQLRRLPFVQVLLAGLSVFTLLAALVTLVVRGGGGQGATATVKPTPTATGSAPASVAPTSTAAPAPYAIAAAPKILHGLKKDAVDPPQVGTAITGLLNAAALGTGVTAHVVDALSGQPLASVGGTTPVPPASTAKLLTAAAALHVLGPNAVLATTVVNGATPGQIVLVGGGDPLLAGALAEPAGTYPAAASLDALAKSTAKALAGKSVTVAYDATLYSGPTSADGWKPGYFSAGNVAPVSALEVDEGRHLGDSGKAATSRSTDPALAAAQQFSTLLRHHGAKVSGTPAPAAPAAGAVPLAKVTSAPVAALVERMLRISDNDLAESLARQVAIKLHKAPTFAGAAEAVAQALVPLGVPAASLHMVDGSGLSPTDTVQASALTALLVSAVSSAHTDLRPLLAGLPVAGFLGTLSTRYVTSATSAGIGAVRAKTGTLTHVSSLAGVVVDADGRQLAFAVIAGHVPSDSPLEAEAALDKVAAALAGCGCK